LCGVKFDDFYFCPHFPGGKIPEYSFSCDCRKPEAGMILQAARENNLDLENSWIVGDSPKDAEAGRRAGCRTILLGDETNNSDFTAKNLKEAAQVILNQAF
jgi:D-glycero-D-manno-heptose 1,7-bisphosphate phosphatase